MRQAGRYLPEYMRLRKKVSSFLELCYDATLSSEITLQPVERFGLDAAIIFSDILVVPHALGQAVEFKPGTGPVLDPIRRQEEISEWMPQQFLATLKPVYESISRVANSLGDGVTMVGFAGAPWTVATYMVEGGSSKTFSYTKGWASESPSGFQKLIERLVAATVLHLRNQIDAGAEVLQIFDSWAGVVSAKDFEAWCIEPVAEIVRAIKAENPEIPIIGFPRGAGVNYIGYAEKTGVNAVSVDYSVSPSWIARELHKGVVVQGNLDPYVLRSGGPVLEEAVWEIKRFLGRGPFIFNLGHGILPDTPPENVTQLVELVRNSRP